MIFLMARQSRILLTREALLALGGTGFGTPSPKLYDHMDGFPSTRRRLLNPMVVQLIASR